MFKHENSVSGLQAAGSQQLVYSSGFAAVGLQQLVCSFWSANYWFHNFICKPLTFNFAFPECKIVFNICAALALPRNY